MPGYSLGGRVQVAPGYSLGERFGELDLRSALPLRGPLSWGTGRQYCSGHNDLRREDSWVPRPRRAPNPFPQGACQLLPTVLNKLDDSLINLLHKTYVIRS